MTPNDENFMREALYEGKKGFALGEVPVGAVLVFEEEVIARAHNLVEQEGDASCHAELLCLREGAKQLGNWRLSKCTLYCTLEPCAQCAGAMMLFRLPKLVYGAPDLRHGADGSLYDLFNGAHPIHQIEVVKGVLAEEGAALMRTFFQKRRQNARSTI